MCLCAFRAFRAQSRCPSPICTALQPAHPPTHPPTRSLSLLLHSLTLTLLLGSLYTTSFSCLRRCYCFFPLISLIACITLSHHLPGATDPSFGIIPPAQHPLFLLYPSFSLHLDMFLLHPFILLYLISPSPSCLSFSSLCLPFSSATTRGIPSTWKPVAMETIAQKYQRHCKQNSVSTA